MPQHSFVNTLHSGCPYKSAVLPVFGTLKSLNNPVPKPGTESTEMPRLPLKDEFLATCLESYAPPTDDCVGGRYLVADAESCLSCAKRLTLLEESAIPSIEGSDSTPTDCPICYDSLSASPAAVSITLCHHAFHLACLEVWLKQNRTCPLCRK